MTVFINPIDRYPVYAVVAETHDHENSEKVIVGYTCHVEIAETCVAQLRAEYDAFCVEMTAWLNANPDPGRTFARAASPARQTQTAWYAARHAVAAAAREGMLCDLGADDSWQPRDGLYSGDIAPEFYVTPLKEIV